MSVLGRSYRGGPGRGRGPLSFSAGAGRGGRGQNEPGLGRGSKRKSSPSVQEDIQLLPAPDDGPRPFMMSVKLTDELLALLLKVEEQQLVPQLKFGPGPRGNVIKVGEDEFTFVSHEEVRDGVDICDLYEEKQAASTGSGKLVLAGPVKRKLMVQKKLTSQAKDKVKQRTLEANVQQKARKSIILDHSNSLIKKQAAGFAVKAKGRLPGNTSKEPALKKRRTEDKSPLPKPAAPKSALPLGRLSQATEGSPSQRPTPPVSTPPTRPVVTVSIGHVGPTSPAEVVSSPGETANRRMGPPAKPAELRLAMIKLLFKSPMTGKAVEKSLLDAMPDVGLPPRKELEQMLKKVAVFKAPGTYHLREELVSEYKEGKFDNLPSLNLNSPASKDIATAGGSVRSRIEFNQRQTPAEAGAMLLNASRSNLGARSQGTEDQANVAPVVDSQEGQQPDSLSADTQAKADETMPALASESKEPEGVAEKPKEQESDSGSGSSDSGSSSSGSGTGSSSSSGSESDSDSDSESDASSAKSAGGLHKDEAESIQPTDTTKAPPQQIECATPANLGLEVERIDMDEASPVRESKQAEIVLSKPDMPSMPPVEVERIDADEEEGSQEKADTSAAQDKADMSAAQDKVGRSAAQDKVDRPASQDKVDRSAAQDKLDRSAAETVRPSQSVDAEKPSMRAKSPIANSRVESEGIREERPVALDKKRKGESEDALPTPPRKKVAVEATDKVTDKRKEELVAKQILKESSAKAKSPPPKDLKHNRAKSPEGFFAQKPDKSPLRPPKQVESKSREQKSPIRKPSPLPPRNGEALKAPPRPRPLDPRPLEQGERASPGGEESRARKLEAAAKLRAAQKSQLKPNEPKLKIIEPADIEPAKSKTAAPKKSRLANGEHSKPANPKKGAELAREKMAKGGGLEKAPPVVKKRGVEGDERPRVVKKGANGVLRGGKSLEADWLGTCPWLGPYAKGKPELRGAIRDEEGWKEYTKEYQDKHGVYMRLHHIIESDRSDFVEHGRKLEEAKRKEKPEEVAKIAQRLQEDYRKTRTRFKGMKRIFLKLHEELAVLKTELKAWRAAHEDPSAVRGRAQDQ